MTRDFLEPLPPGWRLGLSTFRQHRDEWTVTLFGPDYGRGPVRENIKFGVGYTLRDAVVDAMTWTPHGGSTNWPRRTLPKAGLELDLTQIKVDL